MYCLLFSKGGDLFFCFLRKSLDAAAAGDHVVVNLKGSVI
jgi:hypothetical protein